MTTRVHTDPALAPPGPGDVARTSPRAALALGAMALGAIPAHAAGGPEAPRGFAAPWEIAVLGVVLVIAGARLARRKR